MKINKRTCIAGLFLTLLLTTTTYYLYLTPYSSTNGTHTIYVDTDDSTDSLFTKLAPLHPYKLHGFKCLWNALALQPHSGKYQIDSSHTVLDLLRILKNGQQTPVRLLITPTWTLEHMAGRIANQLMIDSATIMDCLNDSTTLSIMNCTSAQLPAHFIPNTYEVYWNITPLQFVKRMEREYQRFWTPERRKQAENLGLSPHEVSTLTSIVCRETNHLPEMGSIARLYLNRLQRGMLLQACPTVIFARRDFTITRLTNPTHPDSPYNTYLHQGLPPGPIYLAPIPAIDAVLHAPTHKYLYMCAKADFSGTHNFATTLAEHQQNARKYQRAFKKHFSNTVKH